MLYREDYFNFYFTNLILFLFYIGCFHASNTCVNARDFIINIIHLIFYVCVLRGQLKKTIQFVIHICDFVFILTPAFNDNIMCFTFNSKSKYITFITTNSAEIESHRIHGKTNKNNMRRSTASSNALKYFIYHLIYHYFHIFSGEYAGLHLSCIIKSIYLYIM